MEKETVDVASGADRSLNAATALPAIRTLVPMAADGVGPSRTSARLVDGMFQAGAAVDVMFNRVRSGPHAAPVSVALPGPLAKIPYGWVSQAASRRLETLFLRSLKPGDIAWLWPSASLKIHEDVARRGNIVVMEGINCRMALAKSILDAAYDAFDAPPSHAITQDRIAEEDAKIALSDTIFASNFLVEEGLAGTRLDGRFLRTSYGVDTQAPLPARTRPDADNRIVYMFCGYACVRKGIHHLLDVWPNMPGHACLQIVGKVEPVIADRYRDVLESDQVEVTGFVSDVDRYYANADVFVFPSLEEGGPLVCYEAAAHGLPAVMSHVGGGRIGQDHGVMHLVDPSDTEAFEAALMSLLDDPERRRAEGAAARVAAQHYDWRRVGEDRLLRLDAFHADWVTTRPR